MGVNASVGSGVLVGAGGTVGDAVFVGIGVLVGSRAVADGAMVTVACAGVFDGAIVVGLEQAVSVSEAMTKVKSILYIILFI
jgi:acyl-[acyl carrier protein]--UDP-N-acetylglucosamine O-acyltransferase